MVYLYLCKNSSIQKPFVTKVHDKIFPSCSCGERTSALTRSSSNIYFMCGCVNICRVSTFTVLCALLYHVVCAYPCITLYGVCSRMFSQPCINRLSHVSCPRVVAYSSSSRVEAEGIDRRIHGTTAVEHF